MFRKSASALLVLGLAVGSMAFGRGQAPAPRPGAEKVKALETITLAYRIENGSLVLTWSPANSAPSGGIKVTQSETNPSPLYPFDGYVKWLPGTGHQQCVIGPGKAATGISYYYRLCSVDTRSHQRYTALSNVVKVPAIAPPAKGAAKATPYRKEVKAPSVKKYPVVPALPAQPAAPAEPVAPPTGGLVIDHNCTDVSKIPAAWIPRAKDRFRFWYGHTSHGSQITSGMKAMNRPPFNYNRSGAGNALSYVEVSGDLGGRGDLRWAQRTRAQLSRPDNDRNVVMWSWCGGCSGNTPEGISGYLEAMDTLEKDFPGVIFIYMTGHLDGSGVSGNLNRCNNQIRSYCRSRNKVLFDFADIESFDPDGGSFLERRADDGCRYDSNGDGRKNANWANEWIARHPNHGIALPASAAHTHPLNGALKSRACWWMTARLAGWNGR